MDIWAAGVVGAFVMGPGVAFVTGALGSVALRDGALLAALSGPALARPLAAAERLAGSLVLAVAPKLLRQSL